MHAFVPVVALAAIVCQAGPTAPADRSVDEIIARHVEAIGGREQIKSIENLVYTGGTYAEATFSTDGTAAMSLSRPFFKLVGDRSDPDALGGFMEGYDGAAWEWFADPGVVIRTVGAASEAGRHYAGVESPFVDYRLKNSTAELIEVAEFEDRPVYVVLLTRRDGFEEYFLIDPETYLVVAVSRSAPFHAFGESVETITKITDYRDVRGVLIAHRFETVVMETGEVQSSMQWGTISANQDLPDDWFSPPQFERTPLQNFIEHLYIQRADIGAVMWTYDEFRLAYPDTDTCEAVNFVGYQMLKMGDTEHAIALLEANAHDYPENANARFELGNAYESAGRMEDAATEYRAALSLNDAHRGATRALSRLTENS